MILVAIGLTLMGGACFLTRALLGPSLADRVVAIDGLIVTIVAVVLLDAARTDRTWFLGVALVMAFVGFVGTAAGARYVERRGG